MTLPARYMRSLWQPTLQDRFEDWLRTDNGLTVYLDVRDRAFALLRSGVHHYGIAALFEAARYERTLSLGRDFEGFRLNNSYRSRLARRLMDDYPDLEGFFETRGLKA